MSKEALTRAVADVGGQTALAEKLGVRQSHVWYWLERSKNGPPGEFVIQIEAATEGRVSRHELRPDLYPLPQHQAFASALPEAVSP